MNCSLYSKTRCASGCDSCSVTETTRSYDSNRFLLMNTVAGAAKRFITLFSMICMKLV